MPQYTDPASVCERGHVIHLSPDLEVHHCPDCGASVLSACPACGRRIQGRNPDWPYQLTPPDFCSNCGGPYPWVGRKGRIYEMENLLAEQKLDPAIELAVREELQALAELDPDKIGGEEETKAWERLKKWAPGLLQTGQAIVVTVASEHTRKQLGL